MKSFSVFLVGAQSKPEKLFRDFFLERWPIFTISASICVGTKGDESKTFLRVLWNYWKRVRGFIKFVPHGGCWNLKAASYVGEHCVGRGRRLVLWECIIGGELQGKGTKEEDFRYLSNSSLLKAPLTKWLSNTCRSRKRTVTDMRS